MYQKLGQHFLKNRSAITKIVSTLELHGGDFVIEIGPGTGALTIPLAKKCAELNCQLVAIEKDPLLARELSRKMSATRGVEIIEGDALKKISNYQFPISNNGRFKLVGNIPYYITGKLLRTIGELEHKPALTVLMIQKEVAERLTAKPGKMNLLAAATQIWAEIKIIAKLKPNDFSPPPKVESAVVKLATRVSPLATREDADNYYKFIKAAFKQPRKTLLNNISDGYGFPKTEALKKLVKLGFTDNSRPQDLSIQTAILLSKVFNF